MGKGNYFPSDRLYDEAACRDMDLNLFFHSRSDTCISPQAREACDRCPVRDECLEYAISQPSGSDIGIWGGTTASERRKMRRARSIHGIT